MPGFKDITVSKTEGNDGFDLINAPGDGGIGPNAFVIFLNASNLPPLSPFVTLQLFPSGHFTAGTDSDGNIAVTATFVNAGNDKDYNIAGGGSTSLPGGFWHGNVRAVLTSIDDVPIEVSVQFSSPVLDDFTQDDTKDPPTNVDTNNATYDQDEDKGEINVTFDYDNHDSFDPVSFAIVRNDEPIGSLPYDGPGSYVFPDVIFNADGNPYVYKVVPYKYGPDSKTPPSVPTAPVVFSGGSPDINVTGSGGIDLGGAATLILIADPSGLYTLSSSLRHDVIYDRVNNSTVSVEIPNPYFKTGLVGG